MGNSSSSRGSAAKLPHFPLSTPHPSHFSSDPNPNPRKRKRSGSGDGEQKARGVNEDLLHEAESIPSKKNKVEVPIACIRSPDFVYPKSAYDGFIPSMPRYSEESVLQDILVKEEEQHDGDTTSDPNDFVEASLQAFVVYHPHKSKRHGKTSPTECPLANELISLHEIYAPGIDHLYFDGVICYAGRRRYVQKVPFKILSIGGYEEPEYPGVGHYIWIQSIEGTRRSVWYRLSHPAEEYKRFHEPFMWMADLAKHLVDYLQIHNGVGLSDLRHRFHDWLQRLYPTDICVRRWLEHYGDRDFRRIAAAHAHFLYSEAVRVEPKYEEHPIWEEMHPRMLRAIPEQVEYVTNKDMFANSTERDGVVRRRKTTVTPYVFDCFKNFPWARLLYCQSPSSSLIPSCHIKATPAKQKLEVRIPLNRSSSGLKARRKPIKISIGDVVAIPKDDNSSWKTEDLEYFGYVQSVSDTDEGQALGLLWFYRPQDTICKKTFYPYPRELFLSDHCNCGDPAVLISEVLRIEQVAFGGSANSSTGFFCRQQYVHRDDCWVTLQKSHFRCAHYKVHEKPRYPVGDTLLAVLRHVGPSLEPVVLLEHNPEGLDEKIRILRLSRKGRDYGCNSADANELVLTDKSEIISETDVHRRCQVRFYSEADKKEKKIPCPYNRQGASDFFYITSQDLQSSGFGLQSLRTPWPPVMRQGWDPASSPPHREMRGLDLFCGGGNFGRGLEEGGAVRFDWAIDWYSQAIHTYKANLPTQYRTKLFHGSVNHYLSQALEGRGSNLVARPGEIEFIIAGNSCIGFSFANPNKGNEHGLLNESLVASVLAFIDFYRPKYAVMENVKGMAHGDTLPQVIGCLVGMGYQVRRYCMDAWSFGCPQSRTRVIITVAAPGLTPLPEPAHTHSHPEKTINGSLGKTANGLHTGSRTASKTPFEYVTSIEATKDLPATDARTTCIPFPDHRMSRRLTVTGWIRASSIPRFPGGYSFVKAVKEGYMPNFQIDSFNWDSKVRTRHDSKSWQRVRRDALMPTVMTAPRPDDGAGGACLHWDDHRLLTIMEARRGQAFPDHEVLIGSTADQWRIVGNSVARHVALALGVSVRTAWEANNARQEMSTVVVDRTVQDSVSGVDDDGKVGEPKMAACTEANRNGTLAQDTLIEPSTVLYSPRVIVPAMSGTKWKSSSSRNQYAASIPKRKLSRSMNSVKGLSDWM